MLSVNPCSPSILGLNNSNPVSFGSEHSSGVDNRRFHHGASPIVQYRVAERVSKPILNKVIGVVLAAAVAAIVLSQAA